MMVKVQYGQTLMDLAIQFYGNASALVELANDNRLALDAEVAPGTELIIREVYPDSATPIFADYLKSIGEVVVSGQADLQPVELLSTNDDEAITDNEENYINV